MKLKLCLKEWKYHDNQCKDILYGYTNKYYNLFFHNYNISKKNNIGAFIKKQTFNLENSLEKQLAKINSFYEILNKIEEPNKEEIIFSITKNNNIIELSGNDMEEDYYYIDNIKDDDYNIFEDKVIFGYHLSDYLNPSLKKDEIDKEWEISYEEFYLLMQIYFGVYKEKELKNKLEEKDKNGEYEEIKLLINKKDFIKQNQERIDKYNKKVGEDMEKTQSRDYSKYTNIDKEFNKKILSKPEVQEYLKLELMRKDTSGAFEGLEIEKIYDKDWSEEKQRKYIDEINKEFGEEVIVKE